MPIAFKDVPDIVFVVSFLLAVVSAKTFPSWQPFQVFFEFLSSPVEKREKEETLRNRLQFRLLFEGPGRIDDEDYLSWFWGRWWRTCLSNALPWDIPRSIDLLFVHF
jgi:hypothetical protein